MSDTFSFTLKSPLTEEQINLITDAEFEHTDRIWFDTPKGKHIEFVKAQRWIPCSERLPEKQTTILVTDFGDVQMAYINDEGRWMDFHGNKLKDVTAWMPLPEPYREETE